MTKNEFTAIVKSVKNPELLILPDGLFWMVFMIVESGRVSTHNSTGRRFLVIKQGHREHWGRGGSFLIRVQAAEKKYTRWFDELEKGVDRDLAKA